MSQITLNTLKKTNAIIIFILFLIGINMKCEALYTKLDHSPNIIIIYSDDQAQWTVGAYGNKDVHTPNMDRLASEGMLFTQGFTKPVCSPSRAMLLTGCCSHRFDIPDYILPPTDSDRGLPPGTPTIASMLKKKGYVTGLIGKWHLGYGEKYYPKLYGFDVTEGFRYIASKKQWPLGKMLFPIDGEYLEKFCSNPQNTDILTERAIKFIRNNQQKPFFSIWPQLSSLCSSTR